VPPEIAYLSIALHAGQAVALVVLWLRKPGESAGEEVQRLRSQTNESIALLKGRLDVIEERVRHMPTSEELRELEGQLSGIRERLAGLDDTAKNTRAAVQRIEDFLRHSK
jgi:ElaB/YqjD/DUF883 family membrane-anchored ribosome-binding protein